MGAPRTGSSEGTPRSRRIFTPSPGVLPPTCVDPTAERVASTRRSSAIRFSPVLRTRRSPAAAPTATGLGASRSGAATQASDRLHAGRRRRSVRQGDRGSARSFAQHGVFATPTRAGTDREGRGATRTAAPVGRAAPCERRAVPMANLGLAFGDRACFSGLGIASVQGVEVHSDELPKVERAASAPPVSVAWTPEQAQPRPPLSGPPLSGPPLSGPPQPRPLQSRPQGSRPRPPLPPVVATDDRTQRKGASGATPSHGAGDVARLESGPDSLGEEAALVATAQRHMRSRRFGGGGRGPRAAPTEFPRGVLRDERTACSPPRFAREGNSREVVRLRTASPPGVPRPVPWRRRGRTVVSTKIRQAVTNLRRTDTDPFDGYEHASLSTFILRLFLTVRSTVCARLRPARSGRW